MLTYNFDDKTYHRLSARKDGVSSSVYESEDEYLKIYHSWDGIGAYKISPEVFKKLSTLRLKNFIHLLKMIPQKGVQEIQTKQDLAGYTSAKIKETKINIVKQDYLYSLQCFRDLLEVAKEISSLGLIMCDTNSGNILTTSNGLVIIDPDQYNEFIGEQAKLERANRKFALAYLEAEYDKCFKFYDKYLYERVEALFAFDKEELESDEIALEALDSRIHKQDINKLIRGHRYGE
jgi:hypothetical protein